MQTNSISLEKLAIGLFGISEYKIWFKVDEQKLKLAEKLVQKEIVGQAQFSIKSINNKIELENQQALKNLSLEKSPFNEEYFLYLSKYSKGILQFEPLKNIATELTEESFEKLFQLFINPITDERRAVKGQPQFQQQVNQQLKSEVFQNRADIKYKLKPEVVAGILVEQQIDLISKNGNILTAQALDFTMTKDTLVKHIYEYEVLIRSLEAFGKSTIGPKHKGAYYLLFNPPAKKSLQEKLLNEIRKSKQDLIKLEDAAYLEELEDKLERKNFSKFSEFIQED